MIHGLDEPHRPRVLPAAPPAKPEGRRRTAAGAVEGEGEAWRPAAQTTAPANGHLSPPHARDEDCSPVGMSCFTYSPDHPLSPFSPPPRGLPARQGLSFQILQILYDSDEENPEPEQRLHNGTGSHKVSKDRLNSTAEDADLNSSFSSSDGGGSRRSSGSMSQHHHRRQISVSSGMAFFVHSCLLTNHQSISLAK